MRFGISYSLIKVPRGFDPELWRAIEQVYRAYMRGVPLARVLAGTALFPSPKTWHLRQFPQIEKILNMSHRELTERQARA